jgi:hypothetical protein
MKLLRHIFGILFVGAVACAPFLASAQSSGNNFRRNGIFGCSVDGAHAMSVGSLSAVGGVYVPVNDAAVTLNTGYLVYKECVLRGVVNRQREAVIAETVRKILVDYTRARDGNPMWSQLIPREQNQVMTKYVIDTIRGTRLDTMSSEVRDPVKRAILRRYAQARNQPTQMLGCTYEGDMRAVYGGHPTDDVLGAIGTIGTPCNPILAYQYAEEDVLGGANAAVDNMMSKLDWGDGTYPIDEEDENGDPITRAPGSIVESNVIQALQSGFRQQESANDIDQMIGGLFAQMSSRVVSDNQGLLALTQRSGGSQSYLDQVVRQAGENLRGAANNAAMTLLVAQRVIEQAFLQLLREIESILRNAANTLRAHERGCWQLIIERVCSTPLSASSTCNAIITTGEGEDAVSTTIRLRVATTTAASGAAISSKITGGLGTYSDLIEHSEDNLQLIDRLIEGVTNSSTDAQYATIEQVNRLVQERRLKSEGDVTQKRQLKEQVSGDIDDFVTNTYKQWTEYSTGG